MNKTTIKHGNIVLDVLRANEGQYMSVGDIAWVTELSRPTIKRYLDILIESKLVKVVGQGRGRTAYYTYGGEK